MFAIWMTGSMFGSGNIPFLPAHSISKLRTRKGAMWDHSPSGECEMNWSYLRTIRRCDACTLNHLPQGDLHLTARFFILDNTVASGGNLNPVHADNLTGSRSRKLKRISKIPWCQSWSEGCMQYCFRTWGLLHRTGLESYIDLAQRCVIFS